MSREFRGQDPNLPPGVSQSMIDNHFEPKYQKGNESEDGDRGEEETEEDYNDEIKARKADKAYDKDR